MRCALAGHPQDCHTRGGTQGSPRALWVPCSKSGIRTCGNLLPSKRRPVVPEHRGTVGRGQVGETPLILGYAGMLPQIAAVATCAFGIDSDIGPMFAFGYATLILSFLGGIWWGFAMRTAEGSGKDWGQGRIATLAVMPSLFGAGLILLSIAHVIAMHWALVLLGSAVMLTLLVDRRLRDAGHAPEGWMAMRIPLSMGLGALTIVSGILCGVASW